MQPYKVIRDTFREAYNLAEEKSPDSSTKVGAIVAVPGGPILYGWNHFLPGFGSDADLERPRKYMLIEHAERHVVYQAANQGISLKGACMLCPWAGCADCARAIILSGITTVIAHNSALIKTPPRWTEELKIAAQLFEHSGVEYIRWAGEVGDCKNLFNGEYWAP